MIRNYFKIAIRSISKNKFFSFINVFGLALSMSVGLILILVMTDFMSSDKFNVNKDRIYRVTTHAISNYGNSHFATSPKPVTDELVGNYPGIEKHVVLTKESGMIMYKQNSIQTSGFYASPEFFEVFSYDLEIGSKKSVLSEPFSVVLSSDLARKLFQDEDVVGKTIKFENLGDFKITGVISAEKVRSHFNFEMLLSFSTIESSGDKDLNAHVESWSNYYQNYSYLLLEEGVDPESLCHNLSEIYAARYDGSLHAKLNFELQKLTDISTGNVDANEIGLAIPFIVFFVFGFITFIVILLAVFNYTNLNIAKYLSRAREVGLRKVIGASKRKIVFQYLTESVLISLIAMLVACLLVEIILPENMMLDPDKSDLMGFPRTPIAYLIFFIFSVFVGVFAGIFPSLYLASFKPLKALKGVIRTKGYARFNWRKLLLTIQFITSIVFVLFTVLLLSQLQDIKNKDLGFNGENKIDLHLQGVDCQLLINELQSHPAINSIAASSSIPSVGGSSSAMYIHPQTIDTVKVKDIYVDHNFISTIGMEVIAGRDFMENDANDIGNNIMITKKASEYFGFKSPLDALGKTIREPKRSLVIVGVVNDFYYVSPIDEIEPVIFRYNTQLFNRLVIDFNPLAKADLFSFIEEKWYQIEQDHPPRYMEVTEEMDVVYKMLNTFFGIIGYISFLSITIACLGLLGIISFNVQSRAKEIGIRKVLGAKSSKIVYTLSKDFIVIVLIALTISLPIVGFVAMQIKMLLPEFVGFDPIAITSGVLLILGLVTIIIASQSHIAIKSNPMEALRCE